MRTGERSGPSSDSNPSAPTRGDWQDVLARFPLAPGELVLSRELRSRTDSKFLLSPLSAARLLLSLTANYAVLAAGTGLIASYRTLYFDTLVLDFFHAHRRGRRVRHKVRIRHYPDRRVSLLEVKTRRSELQTTKIWRQREYGADELNADDQAFVRVHSEIIGDVLPQAWTDFRRVTLLGIHTNERITIDLNLAVQMGERGRSFANVAIVEVKQWPSHQRTPVMSALRTAGRTPSHVSKYCAAIAFIRPDVRRNRLLPDLRTLERLAA